MPDQDRLLHEVADKLAIQDLVVKYAKGRDTTDPGIYKAIFAEDATICAAGGRILSADLDAILAKVATDQIRFNPGRKADEVSYALMRHIVTNVDITLSGETALSDYYITTLANNEAEKRPEVIAVARNEDVYAKRDGRWWIIRSTLNFGWEHDAMGRVLQVGPHTPAEYRR
ncbi:nuclear transport factor 2 family protein (plasmid) [Novosphingobium sp. BL-8A]|uniref:nuclear transport factor 2 family protein n=1 Tax=Novosphingobium sp. BL-8A TaxID=3127639 RepID=UPI003756D9F5